MGGTAEILVSAGVAALLAAIAGGGLVAFGFEVPLIRSRRRQIFLGLAGMALILAGAFMSDREEAERAPVPAVTAQDVIDFRSSDKSDSLSPDRGSGYLLVSMNIAVQNLTEPARGLTWTGSTATLRVGGETIPYAAYKFTNLPDNDEPWLGDGDMAGPARIGPGDVVKHDVVFAPANTGKGRYPWTDFLKAIMRQGAANPTFDVTITTAVGAEEERPLKLHCVGRVDELIEQARAHSGLDERVPRMTVACGK